MASWKEIAGYEELYLVSDHGEVVALPKAVVEGSKVFHRKAKLLKKATRGGHNVPYEFVTLTKDGIRQKFSVHRLVAQAFIPNPNGLPEVNHKDENPLNNSVENLEWCDRRYNMEYSKAKGIEQIKDGSVVARFKSIVRASEFTGIKRTCINNALKGWAKTAGGYEWRYC